MTEWMITGARIGLTAFFSVMVFLLLCGAVLCVLTIIGAIIKGVQDDDDE